MSADPLDTNEVFDPTPEPERTTQPGSPHRTTKPCLDCPLNSQPEISDGPPSFMREADQEREQRLLIAKLFVIGYLAFSGACLIGVLLGRLPASIVLEVFAIFSFAVAGIVYWYFRYRE